MNEQEVQEKVAALKKAPKRVQRTAALSLLLGFAMLLRFLSWAYAGHTPYPRAIFYGLLMLAMLWFNGFSLYDRSRWGYGVILVLALIPLLGIFTYSLHLLTLTLQGSLTASVPETVRCVVALCQLVVTVILFWNLLSKDVRDYVWKPAA
ncbi:MAG: hypothetical protein NTZ16_15145 [Verrucomicrobia bacterium]|nr:hypothetical protein [Verrucomicrobiota bacterium]